MSGPFTLAMVQTTTGRDPAAEVAHTCDQVRAAAAAGADFVMLPETCNMMEPDDAARQDKARLEADDEGLAAFRACARDAGLWLLVGSMVLRPDDDALRLANRSLLIDPGGVVVARYRYDKIHMFDVDLGDGESYRESKACRPGSDVVLADTPWGRLGMTVCYDLRFPALYRTLAKRGADFVAVPSAFTRPTGTAHWHVLLRARAIETGCWVFAPAQCGEHEGERRTFGHSLAVDPWGAVVANGGETPCIVTVAVDPARVDEARARVPSLHHDRPFG